MTSIQERLRAFRTDSKPLHVQQNERGEVYDYTIHKYTPRVCHEAANVIDGLVSVLEGHERLYKNGIVNTPNEEFFELQRKRRAMLATVKGEDTP